jgi:hypothetical protein
LRDAAWRCRGQEAAFALNHHAARLAQRGRDQRNPCVGIGFGDPANPFCPGAGLAKAAPGQDQPDLPGMPGRQLGGARPQLPVMAQFLALDLAQLEQLGQARFG